MRHFVLLSPKTNLLCFLKLPPTNTEWPASFWLLPALFIWDSVSDSTRSSQRDYEPTTAESARRRKKWEYGILRGNPKLAIDLYVGRGDLYIKVLVDYHMSTGALPQTPAGLVHLLEELQVHSTLQQEREAHGSCSELTSTVGSSAGHQCPTGG